MRAPIERLSERKGNDREFEARNLRLISDSGHTFGAASVIRGKLEGRLLDTWT